MIVFKCFLSWKYDYERRWRYRKEPNPFGQNQIVRTFMWLVCFERAVDKRYFTRGNHIYSGILIDVLYLATNLHFGIFKNDDNAN